jgi:hypothetical protein
MAQGNGTKPSKTAEQVAAELRQRLERQLGRERTEAIWRDPTNVQAVVQDEGEAAAVAQTLIHALDDLPAEKEPEPHRRSAFRRGLQIALIAAVAVWAMAVVNKARRSDS